jgi:hypothetical protein
MGPGVRRDDESSVHGATPQQVVIPRACGVSSTLRLFDSITDASDYWIARFRGRRQLWILLPKMNPHSRGAMRPSCAKKS